MAFITSGMEEVAKQSTQVTFRLQVTRAALRVDAAPTENGIQ